MKIHEQFLREHRGKWDVLRPVHFNQMFTVTADHERCEQGLTMHSNGFCHITILPSITYYCYKAGFIHSFHDNASEGNINIVLSPQNFVSTAILPLTSPTSCNVLYVDLNGG